MTRQLPIETIDVRRLRDRIDFLIITIREDEFEAVLRRFTPRKPVIRGLQNYEYCKLPLPTGGHLAVAIVRAYDQGQSVAQLVAHESIQDLNPKWLILSGIAGGFVDSDFSLGDVLLANSLHDFSITAAIDAEQPQFRPSGGPVHPAVEQLLAALPAWRDRLGDWNGQAAIGVAMPPVMVPDDTGAECYYGSDKTRETVRDSLSAHFPQAVDIRERVFKIGAVATANVLLKDTELMNQWLRVARHITHVEMEAGGVYVAARHHRPHELPLLCARGISDIVGFKRAPQWTTFACEVVASFVHALLTTLPPQLFGIEGPNAFARAGSFLSEAAHRIWSNGVLLLRRLSTREAYSAGESEFEPPTLDRIAEGFHRSSAPLLSQVVSEQEYIPRPELDRLKQMIFVNKRRLVCLLGSPGSGKTAILAAIASDAIDSGMPTLCIRADIVPTDSTFAAWTEQTIGLEITALDAVRAVASRFTVLVIIDQLDALAATVDSKSGSGCELCC